jgi:hypothetical protein
VAWEVGEATNKKTRREKGKREREEERTMNLFSGWKRIKALKMNSVPK